MTLASWLWEPGFFFLVPALMWWHWQRRRAARTRIEMQPSSRPLLYRLGLTAPDHFLALPSLTISGHPDRNVSRVTLGVGPEAVVAFLKREHRVSWLVRLRNWLAGFRAVSRSLRECRTLQALQREGLPCPEWIAAGEDAQGRAFLLLREHAGTRGLWQALRSLADSRSRRGLARTIGAALARLHHKGYSHPDLYANHILVGLDGAVTILDWQRSCPRYRVGWRQRGRDLAGLHITLPLHLARDRERCCCLRAYLAETARLTADTGQPARCRGLLRSRDCALLLRGLHQEARRRLRRRHVVEKIQHGLTGAHQDWLRLHGEELCVSSLLARTWPQQRINALALDRQPTPGGTGLIRRWLLLPGQGPLLLTRRSARGLSAGWFRGRRWSSPEQRQSVLLLRLQRHGIDIPQVLAMGQRQQGARRDSFLLTAPPPAALRLDLWLQRQQRRYTPEAARERELVLRQAGATIARLHQACCYLAHATCVSVLAVRLDQPTPAVTLARPECVRPRRTRNAHRARVDLARYRRLLIDAGCDASDVRHWDIGYRRQLEGLHQGIAKRKEATACPV